MMAGHPLDRPIWSALSGRQRGVAVGDERALRYHPDIGPLAGAPDEGPQSLAALGSLIAAHGTIVLLQAEGLAAAPPGAVIDKTSVGVQMVAGDLARPRSAVAFERLGEADVPEMMALAALTEPGPFGPRTRELGTFWGVRQDGRLAAMAGERMKPEGMTEVSGVCTHPDYRGRGYAGLLSLHVADLILARGETPFLHAFKVNVGAVALYAALGFRMRREMQVTFLRPDQA